MAINGLPIPSYTAPLSPGARVSYVYPPTSTQSSNDAPRVVDPNFGLGNAGYGQFLPISAGRRRVVGIPLWLDDDVTWPDPNDDGTQDPPLVNFGVIFGYPLDHTQANTLKKVWANGQLILDIDAGEDVHGADYRYREGNLTQTADPSEVDDKGVNFTPAYRKRTTLYFDEFPLKKYGGTLPSLTAEIVDDTVGRMAVEEVFKLYAEFKGHGYDNLICEGLDGVEIDGLAIFEQDLPLRDFLAVHCPLLGAHFFERGNDIVVKRPVVGTTYTIDKTIDEADLLPVGDDGSPVETYRPGNVDLPDVCEVGFYAIEVNFQRVPARARTRVTNNPKALRYDSCFICQAEEAQTHAWNALYRAYVEATRRTIKLGPAHQDIEPADILAFESQGVDYLVLVTSAKLDPDGTVLIECHDLFTDQSATWDGYAGVITEPA